MKDQNELQAIYKDLLKRFVVSVLSQSSIQMMDRTHVLDLDRLSMYDQDDLPQSAFVARETLVELESDINSSLEGRTFLFGKSAKKIE